MMLPPATQRMHVPQRRPGRQESPVKMDGQQLPPFAEVELFDRRYRLNAGIGNQDVDLAQQCDGLGKAGLDLCLVGNVDRNADGAPGAQFLRHLIGARLIVVGDHDLRTFAGEEPGDLLADAASRAGYDGNFVLETHGSLSDCWLFGEVMDGQDLRHVTLLHCPSPTRGRAGRHRR